MIYEISTILVRVPMILVQIGMMYELITYWNRQGKNKAATVIKAFVCTFIYTQVMHLLGYGLLRVIHYLAPLDAKVYVEQMLGQNIYNILIYVVYIVAKLYRERKSKQRFLQISFVSCIFAMVQISFYYYLFLSNPAGLTERIIGIATICSMIILFVHGAMLELMERIIENQKKQNEEEKKLLEKKYEYDYYLLAQEQEAEIKKIHKDMGNQISLVQELMKTRDEAKKKEAEELLGKMEEEVNRLGRVYYCSDVVLNTILALKQARAKKYGIHMDIQIDSISKTDMEDIDLCSVATNLLDNAIEATEKVLKDKNEDEDYENIDVRIGKRGGYLVFRVDNPVVKAPVKNKKGHFVSTKKEKTKFKEHGRGIRIVEKTLEKYNGSLTFKEEEGRVVVAVFIPTKESEVETC